MITRSLLIMSLDIGNRQNQERAKKNINTFSLVIIGISEKISIFRLRCHSGSSAASQDSLCRCVVLLCCVVAAKSTFTQGLLTQQLEIQDLGSKLNFVSSSATQKGVAYFKSAATPFFNNSGPVGPRKLKFGIQVGNQICIIVLQLRRAWHTSKVLPHPFSITLDPLVLES